MDSMLPDQTARKEVEEFLAAYKEEGKDLGELAVEMQQSFPPNLQQTIQQQSIPQPQQKPSIQPS